MEDRFPFNSVSFGNLPTTGKKQEVVWYGSMMRKRMTVALALFAHKKTIQCSSLLTLRTGLCLKTSASMMRLRPSTNSNMRYPKNGESVAVWQQRKVASIVDTGTSQLISWLRILSRILIRSVFTDLLDPDPYSERKLYYSMKTSLKCFILTIRISILMRIPKIRNAGYGYV